MRAYSVTAEMLKLKNTRLRDTVNAMLPSAFSESNVGQEYNK